MYVRFTDILTPACEIFDVAYTYLFVCGLATDGTTKEAGKRGHHPLYMLRCCRSSILFIGGDDAR